MEERHCLQKASDSFAVRQAASLEDIRWIVHAFEDDGFVLPEKFADINFIADNTCFFFIGELDREPISCISIIRLSETRSCVGLYIVMQPYRGKGYGLRTWKHAWETCVSTAGNATITLYSVPRMEQRYEKFGFRRVALLRFYSTSLKNLLSHMTAVHPTPAAGIRIIPASSCDISKLVLYINNITGVTSRSLICAWIVLSTVSLVALDKKSSVVGCIVVSKLNPFVKHGFNLGPLYADSHEVAANLVKSSMEAVQHTDCTQPDTPIECKVPTLCADPVQFVEGSLGMRFTDNQNHSVAVGMSTQGTQEDDNKFKVFSIASIEMGF